MMTRDEFYLRKLSSYLWQGLDLPGARDMATISTALLYDGRIDLRPATNADAQADADAYKEEQRL